MKKFLQKISQTITGIIIIVAITLIANAWTPPTSAPPAGNVEAPLNTSATTQTKTGKLLFTLFEDQNQPGYYVDPGGNSMFSRIYTTATDLSASFAGPIEANGGIKVDGNAVIDDGAGWHRTYGNTGWYNGTYGGGWYMEDTTWVRSYGNKSVYTGGQMRADAGFCIGGSCLTSWSSSAAGADTLQSVTDRGRSTTQNLQSPRFEDRDNASYFIDPARSGSPSANLAGGITAGGNIVAPGFVDSDNSNYSLDPASVSVLNSINLGGVSRSAWPDAAFSGAVVMSTVPCPSGWTRLADLDSRFPRGATAYGGAGGSAAHVHSGEGSMARAGLERQSFPTSEASNLPPYFNVIFCLKN